MVDVDTSNFSSVLLQLRSLIPESDFIAIDMEFSGLEEAPCSGPECFSPQTKSAAQQKRGDSNGSEDLQARYDRLRAATSFLVLQVGICPFFWDDESSSFAAYPYNFYIFPNAHRGQDRRFLCQTRCISFLTENKFDFNKLFHSGIPFMNHDQQASASEMAANTATEAVLKQVREEVVNFLADTSKSSHVLPPMNPFHRKLTYEYLNNTFQNAVTTDRATVSGDMCIKVSRTSKWHEMGRNKASIMETVEARVRDAAEKELHDSIGFRHVIDLLVESGKPIVGHNMLLDLVMMYAHFWGEPPQQLSEFEKALHEKFPVIIDTKYLISSAPSLSKHFSNGSRLDWVHKTCSASPFTRPAVRLAQNHERYSKGHLHEAGYDAYITGHALLRLGHLIMMESSDKPMQAPLPKNTTGLTPRMRDGAHLRPYYSLFKKLRKFANRLLITGSKTGVICLESDEAEEESDSEDRDGAHTMALDVSAPQLDGAWQIASHIWSGRGHGGKGQHGSKGHMHPHQSASLPKQRARDQSPLKKEGGASGPAVGKKEKRPRMSV